MNSVKTEQNAKFYYYSNRIKSMFNFFYSVGVILLISSIGCISYNEDNEVLFNKNHVNDELNEDSERFEIHLNSRSFIPEPGISDEAKSELESLGHEKVHVYIQLQRPTTSAERAAIREDGVEILGILDSRSNTFFASIMVDKLEEVAAMPLVRSIAIILPEDKIAYWIKNGVGSHAINDDGTVNLTVLFFEDTSFEEAKKVISNYGNMAIEIDSPTFNDMDFLIVTMKEDAIPHLASEDRVQWIEEIPGPPTIDV